MTDHADDRGTQRLTEGSDRAQPRLAIVVPCCNEEAVIRQTAARLTGVLRDLVQQQRIAPSSFVYFVDDGSTDSTWSALCDLHKSDEHVKALKLARNFGHQNALLAGLMSVRNRADCVVTMDADLQHDERAIAEFLEKYREGADIVFGVRRERSDPYFKKLGSNAFYSLMRAMGTRVIKDSPDYRLVSAKVLEALADYPEVNLFLRGIFADLGFKSEFVPFDERQRSAGVSKYSWSRMLAFALSGITSFSVTPLRFIAIAGALIMLLSLALVCYVVVSWLRGNAVPGWASTLLPIYLLGGLQIMLIGVVAEYIGRIYSEVKRRPRFIKEQELA